MKNFIVILLVLLPGLAYSSPKYMLECNSLAGEVVDVQLTAEIDEILFGAKLTGDIKTDEMDLDLFSSHEISSEFLPGGMENYNVYEVMQDLEYWTASILPKIMLELDGIFTGYLYVMDDLDYRESLVELVCGAIVLDQ